MSTFMDLVAIDLHPGHDPGPVLAALRDGATDSQLWIGSLPDERSRLLLCLDMGAAHSLIKHIFAVAGEHVARILVESDGDEYGVEHVVLANRQGRPVRTHHISIDGTRTKDRIPEVVIDLVANPPVPDLFEHLPADLPDRVRADPAVILDYPELHHLLRSSGTYSDFPVDEGLTCESDDLDDVLNGPQARARTAELYGVEVAALESMDRWRALGVETPSGKPDLVLGKPRWIWGTSPL